MKIEKATRKSHFYNEDRYIVGENYCMVLDGATSLVSSGIKPTEGSWFVSRIKDNLPQKCDNVLEKLKFISKKTYAEFIELSKINHGDESVLYYPSAGLSCAAVNGEKVQIFTTGDCEAVVKLKDGKIIRHVFPMLADLDKGALDMMIEYKKAHGVSMLEARKALNSVLIENRKLMNKMGGYPVFTVSNNPDFEYIKAEYNIDEIKEIYLYSDGIAQAFDELQIYSSCEEMFSGEVDIFQEIKKIKERAFSDKTCEKYPRFKVIDDIVIVKITF